MESITRIETYTSFLSNKEEFIIDQKTHDACLMNLVNIGEMVARLSSNFTETHSDIDWFRIRGLRNIIAHDYFGIDLDEIWSILTIHVPALKAYIENIEK